jgi:hypothetical protein
MTRFTRDTSLFELHKLPNSLAVKSSEDSRYDFQGFEPDPGWVENIGTVEGAVNRELECRLGLRANGLVGTGCSGGSSCWGA